jgi:hypothetical protein
MHYINTYQIKNQGPTTQETGKPQTWFPIWGETFTGFAPEVSPSSRKYGVKSE